MIFKCIRCGKCCRMSVYVTPTDLQRWKNKERWDIISDLVWEIKEGRKVNPLLMIKRKENEECIFLEGNVCRIYEDRPETCKWFPYNNLNFDCPGFDKKSITNEDRVIAMKFLKRKMKMNEWIASNEKFLESFILHAKRKLVYK